MRPNLQFHLRLRCYVKQSDSTGLFITSCPTLDIKSQGRTEEEAKAALRDSIELFLLHCWKRGIIAEALARRGFEPCSGDDVHGDGEIISMSEMPAAPVDDDVHAWDGDFTVPFHVIMDAQRRMASGDRRWPA